MRSSECTVVFSPLYKPKEHVCHDYIYTQIYKEREREYLKQL